MSKNSNTEEQIIIPLELEKCLICLENEAECQLLCGHKYCQSCILEYIHIKIEDGEVLKIPCPTMTCIDIDETFILQFVSTEDAVKYHKFAYIKKLESDVNFRWCPQKECKGYDVRESSNKLKCQECNFEFCFLCADKWHKGECNFLKGINAYSARPDKKIKFCPICHVRTEKNGGCNSVTCRKCSTAWCYKCSKPQANHNTYACYVGEKWYNPKISVALILFFMPILMLFSPFVLLLLLLINHELRPSSRDKIQTFFLNHSILSLFLLLILSPLITVLMGIGFLIYYVFIITSKCFKKIYCKNYFCIITITVLSPLIVAGALILIVSLFPIALGLSIVFGAILILIKIPGSLCACALNRFKNDAV